MRKLTDQRLQIEVTTDKNVQIPGEFIEGSVAMNLAIPLFITSIKARLLGEANVAFTSKEHYQFANHRTFVDDTQELWHFSTINHMLGMDLDKNSNTSSNYTLHGKCRFPFKFHLPSDCPTSFHCQGSPVSIKYVIEITLYSEDQIVVLHEHSLAVLVPFTISKGVIRQQSTHSKHYRFPKERNIYLQCTLNGNIFTSADRIEATVSISNKWKQSLKHVHMSIVRRIVCDGSLVGNSNIGDTHVVNIDTTGVGLPAEHPKVCVGEMFTFNPTFNVPALPPSMTIDGVMSTDYMLKISVGRAFNYIIATLRIPITIVTDVLESDRRSTTPPAEEMLIDFSNDTSPVGCDLLL